MFEDKMGCKQESGRLAEQVCYGRQVGLPPNVTRWNTCPLSTKASAPRLCNLSQRLLEKVNQHSLVGKKCRKPIRSFKMGISCLPFILLVGSSPKELLEPSSPNRKADPERAHKAS